MEALFAQLLKEKIELQNENDEKNFFQKINPKPIKTETQPYSLINASTLQISSFFDESIEKFPSLFEKNLSTFNECLTDLEKSAIPNKCVCAGGVDNIPGWHCVDCSKYENTLYCHDCYVKSRDLHENHKVLYLCKSRGMCDCGDPDSLYINCHEHSGPFNQQKQIDDYIEQNFGKKVVDNLKTFFDEFFMEFSKYLIIAEKCDMFINDEFNKNFPEGEELNEKLNITKEDMILIKSNFCIVFQNMIYFLRLITKKNLGMLHLIANYFLKNHFNSDKLEEDYMTTHSCIELSHNEIKISFDSDKKENHICKCPFARLFLSNYRKDIKLKKKEDEDGFLYSFSHNLFSRYAFGIINFFLFEQNLYNDNKNISTGKYQFYLEDVLELIAKKSTLFEKAVEISYKYALHLLKNEELIGRDNMYEKFQNNLINLISDSRYFSKPKMLGLMTDKTSFFKRIIDLIGLMHNIDSYKSIYPHPQFQDKTLSFDALELVLLISRFASYLCSCFQWEKIEKLKEIYKYIIYKILNQEKEGIIQLGENEFSCHLSLYRFFGSFMNAFCFNYSFMNNCTILESINYFKNNFFDSKEQIQQFCDIILNDYFKFFGLIGGTNNNFFNYYDKINVFYTIFFQFIYVHDSTLLKYIFLLNENNIDINSYLKKSNIENIYSTFDNIFNKGITFKNEENIEPKEEEEKKSEEDNTLINGLTDIINRQYATREEQNFAIRRLLYDRNNNNYKSKDDNNILMQWEFLIQLLIYIIKSDSCFYNNLIDNYEEIISSKTKTDLFNNVTNNKYAMEDLNNILQEKIIHILISEGNLIDMKKLEKKMDNYLMILFEENDTFNKILNELTFSKLNEEKTQIFYLKDEYLKCLDCNYYSNNKTKSEAQKYILDFKKDVVKTYNYYYYNQSYLTFEFVEKVYEKVLLDKNNLELISRMIEKLLNDDRIMENLDKKSIRNSLLPLMLNYLSMLSVINTKSFIEFKLQNKDIISKLYNLLFAFVKDNAQKNIIDKDLEDNIKEVLNQMNRYQLIYDYYEGDLSKLNKYDFNTNILEKLKQEEKSKINNINLIQISDENNKNKKSKLKNAKDKLKSLMKKKANNFMKQLESSEEMLKAIDEEIKQDANKKDNEEEIMCFYCRNSIKLNSFEEPYGKPGLTIEDLFFYNSIKATLRDELKDNEDIYNKVVEDLKRFNFVRLISCGHYFHKSCFQKGLDSNENGFSCPLCLKKQNILIPPLTQFHDKYYFFKSQKIDNIFGEKENISMSQTSNEVSLFDNIIKTFLKTTKILRNIQLTDNIILMSVLNEIYLTYRPFANCLKNIFYVEGTTFHKQQQIDNIKNLILSLRFIFYQQSNEEKEKIFEFIKATLIKLAQGLSTEEKYIYQENDSFMHIPKLLEKIIMLLMILFDYEEIKGIFKYIIYIFLPYFTFGLYFKKLIIENYKNKDNKEQINKMLNNDEFKKYLENENKSILDNFYHFLKKFCFIKLISDYKNKNEDIINSFNELSLKTILNLIDMEDLEKLLPQKELSIKDIIQNLPKTFNSNDIFYKEFSSILNYDKVLNSIFENVKKYNDKNYEISKELIIQFSPIKFDFIHLEKNIFDFYIKNAGKPCIICEKVFPISFLCLICGEKVCLSKSPLGELEDIRLHIFKCSSSFNIFIEDENMNLVYIDTNGEIIKLFPIYVNKNGNGPKGNQISNEFFLNQEKIKLAVKNYICDDFNKNL